MYVKLLFFMIFLHIIDDFYLQGILAKLKQKTWWEENAPDEKYKNDWFISLMAHAFSWTMMIHLPILYLGGITVKHILLSVGINMIVHAITDHLKCNAYKINLCQDQFIHLAQICITFIVYVNTVQPTRTF